MELIKINEAYNLTDVLDNGWSVQGQVIKENNGVININFQVSEVTNTEHIHIGNYNYNIPNEELSQNISVNYNCNQENENKFVNYSENIIDQVLEQLNISLEK